MKTVRTLLYVFSAFFMLSVVFLFLPWDWLNAFMALFGEYVFPHDSLVQYTVRMMLALAFCFSLGDLGVIALFGTQDFQTLPLMMYRALGSYKSNDAAAIAAMLLIFTIVAFVGLPRLIERIAHAPRR